MGQRLAGLLAEHLRAQVCGEVKHSGDEVVGGIGRAELRRFGITLTE